FLPLPESTGTSFEQSAHKIAPANRLIRGNPSRNGPQWKAFRRDIGTAEHDRREPRSDQRRGILGGTAGDRFPAPPSGPHVPIRGHGEGLLRRRLPRVVALRADPIADVVSRAGCDHPPAREHWGDRPRLRRVPHVPTNLAAKEGAYQLAGAMSSSQVRQHVSSPVSM